MEGFKKQAILIEKTSDSACDIRYQHSGDYYIPVLKLPEESRFIGHWGVTENLKADDPMAWVGAMNSIRSRAEEIILQELIYEEGKV